MKKRKRSWDEAGVEAKEDDEDTDSDVDMTADLNLFCNEQLPEAGAFDLMKMDTNLRGEIDFDDV